MMVNSDFVDYYDKFIDNFRDGVVYNRYISKSMARGKALCYLNNMGIKTIELKQVVEFSTLDGDIVVYRDIYAHNGKGKAIMSVNEALKYHSNCLASKFYITDGTTIKFLQVGQRRFYVTYKKNNVNSLEIGNIVNVQELPSAYNDYIRLPIFSIDYIPVNGIMAATDFNECQNMQLIGLDSIMTGRNAVYEIKNAIKHYNI